MIGVKEIRDFAITLPDVEEGPPVKAARRIAAFKVAGKSFLGIEAGGTTITVSLDEEQARTATARFPEACEAIWRNREIFMGLRVELSKISARGVRELIEASWRRSAPARALEAYKKRTGNKRS